MFFKSSKSIHLLLLLIVIIVFSVLGASDMLKLKQLFMVEGFVSETDGDKTYYAAQGPEGNIVYGNVDNNDINNNNPNNYNARAGSVTTENGTTYYAAQGPQGNVVVGKSENENNSNVRAGSVTTDDGTTYFAAQGPRGNVVTGQVHNESGIYYPTNKPYNDTEIIINDQNIPPNQNNFIKKTQIVPPVCPACPYPPPPNPALDKNGQPKHSDGNPEYNNNSYGPPPPPGAPGTPGTPGYHGQQNNSPGSDHCPPCPACERCPEPAFECKKVPNYKSPASSNYLPMPVLNDFSSF